MNRNLIWKIIIVVFIVAWAATQAYPPGGRNVIDVFEQTALAPDDTFRNIVQTARGNTNNLPPQEKLLAAIGTNEITSYFPGISVEGKPDPNRHVFNQIVDQSAGQVKLGIDLQGGTSFLLRMDTSQLDSNSVDTALVQAIEVLRLRVDKLGVSEPTILPVGDDRIQVQLPGLSKTQMDRARTLIQQAAFLEFRMVHPESDVLLAQNLIPPGYEIKMQKTLPGSDRQPVRAIVTMKPERGLTGKYLTRAYVERNPLTAKPEIAFAFDGDGARIFGEITRQYQPENTPQGPRFHRLAIILDGVLYSAPRIDEPIEGGRGQITGDFSAAEAFDLASALENPLESQLEIEQERTVDPSLGEDSIQSGIRAGIYGIITVAVFMLIYYMMAGLIANVALLLNVVILLGALCEFDATLTLPGIAGIILTIGMAVDANVLIFERIREEIAAGKSLRGSVAAGYNKAFGTIIDSNLTTFITAIILFYMGSGPVKGFGLTLAFGIGTSMFTALVVTRLCLDLLVNFGVVKSIPMLQLFGRTKIDFLRLAKPAFTMTWILIVAGLAYGIFVRGSTAVGVDFAGGDSMRLGFTEKLAIEDIRGVVDGLNIGSSKIQYQQDLGTGEEDLLVTVAFREAQNVEAALIAAFPNAGLQLLGVDAVGPVVGQEILRTALIAMLMAFFGILVYVAFRFELSFAIGAITAILHDLLMTLGLFFFWGGELSAPMVAALLTIIGFSINDTIVIFDRIREDLKLGVRGSFKEVMNLAINKTLSRTIITSGTTFLAAFSLFIFGGGVINAFAFTFLAGILTGTYSSIYIASAIVLWWHKGERPRTASQVIVDQPAGVNANA